MTFLVKPGAALCVITIMACIHRLQIWTQLHLIVILDNTHNNKYKYQLNLIQRLNQNIQLQNASMSGRAELDLYE